VSLLLRESLATIKPKDKTQSTRTDGVVGRATRLVMLGAALLCCHDRSIAQATEPLPRPVSTDGSETIGQSSKLFVSGVVHDQVGIWTSPARIHYKDLAWLLPLGAVTGLAIATDHDVVQHLPSSASFAKHSTQASTAGLAALAGTGAILFFDGHIVKNEHASETGRLAAEAAVDGVIFNVLAQEITRRQRPFALSHPGEFFYSGGRAFPSTHAITSWTIATVIAHEYPGTLTKILSYGTALGVSTARVLGRDHSPSDVIVGSAAGFLIGEYVYHHHHNRDLPGSEVPALEDKASDDAGTRSISTVRSPGSVGSAYVALDSPIYDRIERLAALGYIHSEFLGLRPWTRMTCARMIQEASANHAISDGGEPAELYASLSGDFAYELGILNGNDPKPTASLDRAYTRVVGIAGPPLNDSYHFGQSIYNDFGRPYQEGFNNQTGVEGSASYGRFELSVRGEYQGAAAPALYTPAQQELVAQLDVVPHAYFHSPGTTNRLELLDAYAGMTAKDWQFSIGKQSLWEGVDSSTALIISNNIDPMYMFRINRVAPLVLPSFLKLLGPLRTEFFLGATEGHHYPGRPWVQGAKLSFKPSPNFEFGFSRTVLFAGAGRGLTLRSFWKAFSSVGDNSSTIPGSSKDVGDRRGEFDFRYRLPYLRNWVAVYGDFMTDDDPTPLAAPDKSILAPGIEFTKFPKLPRLQLKIEGIASDAGAVTRYNGNFFYYNGAYHDGYTNRGDIIGSWIGRDSRAVWSEAKYWVSSTHTAALAVRTVELDHGFIPYGGRTTDVSLGDSYRFQKRFNISAKLQYERWNIPVLAQVPQRSMGMFLELSYSPHEQ
jgi:membrane-associated phospholipid phosphatase